MSLETRKVEGERDGTEGEALCPPFPLSEGEPGAQVEPMCPAGSEAVGESTSRGEKKPSSGDYKISHLARGGEQEAVGLCLTS